MPLNLKQFVISFLIMTCSNIHGQNYDLIFKGMLMLTPQETYNYELHLNLKKKKITGISITDKEGANETKAEVSGSLENKILKIDEIQILSTKSESPIDEFCYIHFEVPLTKTGKGKAFNGQFQGKYMNDSLCATGMIIGAETKLIEKVEKIVKKRIDKEITKVSYITPSDSLHIDWKSDTIEVLLWDANISDGDRIDLSLNDKIYLRDHEVFSKIYTLKIPLKKGENELKIKALNNGDTPPNTVRFEFIDADKRHPVITQIETGKAVSIKIIR